MPLVCIAQNIPNIDPKMPRKTEGSNAKSKAGVATLGWNKAGMDHSSCDPSCFDCKILFPVEGASKNRAFKSGVGVQ